MTIVQKLKNLNLPTDSTVTFSYSEGTDVFVHNETEVETALSGTDVVAAVAELVATPKLIVSTRYGGNVLESLREEGLLEDYERGSYSFSDYLAETIEENFYDQEIIEYSIQKYDYKRGFCTLSTSLTATLSDLIDASPYLGGWDVSVSTEAGTLTIG